MSETDNRLIDEGMIRRAVSTLIPHGNVFEVRILTKRGKSKNLSGYFTNADQLLEAFQRVDLRNTNVYITLQEVDEDCYSRSQHDHFEQGATATTDGDIVGYNWLFIDLDPIRKSEISSTMEELTEAAKLAREVYDYLQGIGFEKPLVACSGNGMHLLYKIALVNSDENKALIERCLTVLGTIFNTEKIKIDTVNFNPSRICKLYGTLAQKGSHTEKRPHRMSAIISQDEEIRVTKKAYLEKLASAIEIEEPKAERYNNYNPGSFDIVGWMASHGMRFTEKSFPDGARKFVLDECPFNAEHKAPDSFIVLQKDGRIGFHCSHNSCSGKTWHELWTKVDPDTYGSVKNEFDKRIEEGWKKHNASRTDIHYAELTPGEAADPIWMTMEDIVNEPDEVREFIKTGTNILDQRMMGLEKGAVSLVSGLRGGGKSTLINGWMLNAIQDGHTIVCYSGELSRKNMVRWMNLQAAGKAHTVASSRYENLYYTTKETDIAISRWIGDRFWLFNNEYGNNLRLVFDLIRRKVEESHADFVVIDNLMALSMDVASRDKWDLQTDFIWQLKTLAKTASAHVLFVAHPRKATGFLRLDDVSGSGNIGNIVDNAFIVHRNNDDFRNRTKAEYKRSDDWEGYSGTNVIEICKNRDNGAQDVFIPLWYEPETKRLKNFISENIVYGWTPADSPDGFTRVDVDLPW